MKALLPSALFIGFTGTPLLAADKQKSIEIFGPYIHTYKYDEAVRDGVVLDLRYEARDIDQQMTSPDKVDQWFEIKTKGLSDVGKARVKKRWAPCSGYSARASGWRRSSPTSCWTWRRGRVCWMAAAMPSWSPPASTPPVVSSRCSKRPISPDAAPS
jgi:hypothetical protein